MRRTGKRLGALLLALVMVLSLLPMSALAARAEDDELTIAAPESGNAAAVSELPTSPGDSAELLAVADLTPIEGTTLIALDDMTPSGPAPYGGEELPKLKDEDSSTHYGSTASFSDENDRYVQIALPSEVWLSGLYWMNRGASNGAVTKYAILSSLDGSNWCPVTDNRNGEPWVKTENTWNTVAFDYPVKAKYVKVLGVEAQSNYISCAELRLAQSNDTPTVSSATITVQGDAGSPLVGATVKIAGQSLTTNDQGQATPELIDGQAYTGIVTADSYAPGTVTITGGSGATATVSMLKPSDTVSGTITDGENNLDGATVSLVNANYAAVDSITAATTSGGAYTLSGFFSLDAGTYYIRVSMAGYGTKISQTPIVVASGGATTAIDGHNDLALDKIGDNARYHWDFSTGSQPADDALDHTTNAAVTYENDAMKITWTDGTRDKNLVSIKNTNAKNLVMEFDATRQAAQDGENTNSPASAVRFGLAARIHGDPADGGQYWIYVGQESAKSGNGWGVEVFKTTKSGDTITTSGGGWKYNSNGPTFKGSETRHFKVTFADSHITLEVDGIPVVNNFDLLGSGWATRDAGHKSTVPDSELTLAGDIGILWGNSDMGPNGNYPAGTHYVTIDNLYVFRNDPSYRVTWENTLNIEGSYIDNGTKTLENDTSYVPAGSTVTIQANSSAEAGKALTGLTVARNGQAPEGTTDAQIAVTAKELAGGTHSFSFAMPNYPVTVSGAFKTKVGTPTVAAENDIFRVGKTLTATPAGSDTVNYQWYRHEADHDPVLIEGATEQTYALVAADEGKTIFVKVTGTGEYAGWAQSDETTTILPAVVEVPENGITFTRANGITMWLNDKTGVEDGNEVGTTTTVIANVTGSPTKPLTVTWESSDATIATIEAIPDAQNGNLTATLTAKKVGDATITVKMTAKDGTVERSATLNVTVKAHITGIAVKNGETAVTEQAPLYLYANSNEELSAINDDSGTKVNHAVLTATLTEPTGGASANEKKLDWTRSDTDNVLINFSVSDDTLTYTVDPASKANTAESNAKVGVKTITVSSLAKPTVTTSFKIYVVRHLVNDVTINGTAQVGKDLTAGIQRLNIPTDKQSGLTYKWIRLDSADATTGTEVGTGSTYTVQDADAGKYIKLEVTAAVNETSGFFYEGVRTAVTAQIAKKAGPDAPINLVGVKPSGESTNDGKITGLTSNVTYEYKVKTDSDWTEISGVTEITGLAGNTVYEVRVKVENTDAQELGAATEVRIPAYNDNYKTITITQPEHGTVTTSPAGSAEPTSQVTITATPAEGYAVDTVTVTDADNGPVEVTENKFTMPDKDVTVTVTFHPTQITIHHVLENMTCSLAETEAAQGTNSHQVTYGVDPEITLIPAEGYKLPNTLYNQEAGTGIFTDEAGTQRYNHYTFNETTGRITFNADYFPTQDLWIKAKATKITHNVAYTAQTGYTAPTGGRDVDHNGTYTVTITPNDGYRMPASITVKMKDAQGTYQTLATTAYTYTPNTDKTSADISIPNITGDVQITIPCEEITYAITGVSITITHNDTATVEQDIPHVGDTLHANVTHEAPTGTPVTATYQWYRGTALISGTTGSTYTVTADDLDQAIKVVVTGNKPFSSSATSTATNAVKAKIVHVESVTVTPATATLIVGKTQQLTATVTPSGATNPKVTWGSDDNTVATVSETGLVTAVSAGTTTIRATTEDGGKTSTCAVTVEAAPETGVILTGSAQVGEKLTAEIFPENVTYTIKWVRVAEDNTETELTETGLEYTLVEADKGSKIKVVVTIEEQEYTAESGTVTAAPVILKPEIKLSASPASLPTAGGDVVLTVTVPEEITNGTVTVTCGTEGIEITKNEEDGTYAVTLPEGRATYTFTATLTAGTLEDGTAYDSAEATCTVRVGSRPATSTTPTTPSETTSTQVKEDGTKVTTVTKPDGTVTETTEAPDGTVAVVETKKDGTVTETVSQPDGTKSEAITTPEGDKTITVTDPEGEEIAKVELPAEIPAPEAKFEDVTQAAPWAEEAINKVAGLKLVEGTGNNKYDPISPMTRGALATVLHRLSQGKTDYEVTFQDVAAGKYYTEGVAWAAKVNVVKGLSEDVFAPEQVITREQLAVMLARYAKLIGMDTKADAKALDQFADGSATNDWAVDGVAWCVENGILQGKGADVLDPGNNVTRAEVAVMLDRFIALIK